MNSVEKVQIGEKKNCEKNKYQGPRSLSYVCASLLKFSGRNNIGEKKGKFLFFEVACLSDGIENFDLWNQTRGTIHWTTENFRSVSLIDFLLETISNWWKTAKYGIFLY